MVSRHGSGTPTLVNYDVLRESELFSGFSEEDAWNVSYSGCQWYCSVGNEYQDQDVNCIVLIQPMQRAIEDCLEKKIGDFDGFWAEYDREVNITADALVNLKNAQYRWQHKVWPEMVTSTCMNGPLDVGRDVTDTRAVNNNYTSVNILGVPNVVDSAYAIKKLVFEDKMYALEELRDALRRDWEGDEVMRLRFLNADKFGNDLDDVDAMAVKISEHIRSVLENRQNIQGFHVRPSLFQFMGHTVAGPFMGATPDGRHASEFLAHGMNPMHGRTGAASRHRQLAVQGGLNEVPGDLSRSSSTPPAGRRTCRDRDSSPARSRDEGRSGQPDIVDLRSWKGEDDPRTQIPDLVVR